MQTNIRKWGNSAGTTLPAALLKKAGLQIGDVVELEVRGDEIVIKPAAPRYTLEQLLSVSDADAFARTEEDAAWLGAKPAGREDI